MYALNCTTGLPLARKYLMKGKNWNEKLSSKSMESFAVKQVAEELHAHNITITHVVHDKNLSTLFHLKKVFSNIQELICTGMYFAMETEVYATVIEVYVMATVIYVMVTVVYIMMTEVYANFTPI